MSAHAILNLLNELGKIQDARFYRASYQFSPTDPINSTMQYPKRLLPI